MNRRDALEIFARMRKDEPVILSPGVAGSSLFDLGHKDPTIYNMDFSYAAPMCFGLALARPELKVVAIEGDGSMLAGLGFLTTAARYEPKNLVIIVFDNEAWLSAGTEELVTATAGKADLEAIARGAGIQNTITVRSLPQFEEALKKALTEEGLFFIVAKVNREDRYPLKGKMISWPIDIVETAIRFRRALMERKSTDVPEESL